MSALEESQRRCAEITRAAGSNFTWTFRFLPKEKREAMVAIYAFMRTADDLVVDLADDLAENPAQPAGDFVDSETLRDEKKRRLSLFRRAFEEYCAHEQPSVEWERERAGECFTLPPEKIMPPEKTIFPALEDAVRRFSIPCAYFRDVLDGMEADLTTAFYRTQADLENYCYRAASAVGLICLHVWGVDPEKIAPHADSEEFRAAVACGKALQWTNILRDVREDALRGRVYLPLDDFSCSSRDFEEKRNPNQHDDRAPDLLRHILHAAETRNYAVWESAIQTNLSRAAKFYQTARGLGESIPAPSRRVFFLITNTYYGIYQKIDRAPATILEKRVRLNAFEKLLCVWRSGKSTQPPK
ncbi:MAG: phytoene/squalene synthase family protein [Planctomycetia bacterium]|nr:phytoene/squalene synthase family protein [Planctomycetia bacterium]